MLHLARRYDGRSVTRAEVVAEAESIPTSFLAQIFNELKKHGLVMSRRGKTGGWILAKSPKEISLLTLVEVLEPEALGESGTAKTELGGVLAPVWLELREKNREILSRYTLEVLGESVEPMFYI